MEIARFVKESRYRLFFFFIEVLFTCNVLVVSEVQHIDATILYALRWSPCEV